MKSITSNTIGADSEKSPAQNPSIELKPFIEEGARRLEVQPATEAGDIEWCQQALGQEHYLGPVRPAGDRLFQIVRDEGKPVAVLLWAACAWHLEDRDKWIDWDPLTRSSRLKLIVNNWRFLVLEETRRPNLASQCMGAALRVLCQQWESLHGYQPLLAETFTDPESHAGTCYKASGWMQLGQTKGFARHRADYYVSNERPKKLWVRELHKDALSLLCATKLPAQYAGAQTDGGGVRSVLKADQLRSLVDVFRKIPDPRARQSMRYPLFSVLTIVATALLGGAVHIAEICRAGQRLNQRQRALIGLRFKKNTRFRPAPSYAVYRDLLAQLDVNAMAEAFNEWLGEHDGILPRTLAMDGKTIVHQLGQMVSIVDTSTGIPVAMACNDEGDELVAAQQLLASGQVNLINATVSADALHCQKDTARQIVTGGGDYLLRVKGNQPELLQCAQKHLEASPPLFVQAPRRRTGASKSGSFSPNP